MQTAHRDYRLLYEAIHPTAATVEPSRLHIVTTVCFITYVIKDWTQVLFFKYFIYDWVICHFHIASYLTNYVCFGELLSMRTLCDAYHE